MTAELTLAHPSICPAVDSRYMDPPENPGVDSRKIHKGLYSSGLPTILVMTLTRLGGCRP